MFHRLSHEVEEDYQRSITKILSEDATDLRWRYSQNHHLLGLGETARVTPPVMTDVPRRPACPRKPTQPLLEHV